MIDYEKAKEYLNRHPLGSRESAENALNFLLRTDEELARAKKYYDGILAQKETIITTEAVTYSEGGWAERKSIATTSPEYEEWREKMENALYDYEILKNMRSTADKIWDHFRSINSARKMGQTV